MRSAARRFTFAISQPRCRRAGTKSLFLLGVQGPVTDLLKENRVRFAIVPNLGRAVHPWKDALAYQELRTALREWRPDLVSTHTAKAGFLGRAAARSLKLPVLYTPHGWTDRRQARHDSGTHLHTGRTNRRSLVVGDRERL